MSVLCALFLWASAALASDVQKGQVTLLDIGSDCLPCALQDTIVRRVEKAFGESVRFVYIDIEKKPEIQEKYAVKTIPTLIFFNKNGEEVQRNSGYMKESAIRERLTKLMDTE